MIDEPPLAIHTGDIVVVIVRASTQLRKVPATYVAPVLIGERQTVAYVAGDRVVLRRANGQIYEGRRGAIQAVVGAT